MLLCGLNNNLAGSGQVFMRMKYSSMKFGTALVDCVVWLGMRICCLLELVHVVDYIHQFMAIQCNNFTV